MTQILLRLFVRNRENTQDPKVRSAIGSLSGIVGIGCNLLLFLLKLLVGTLAASVSITADAMNNLSDATSSIVTLIGFKLAEKPADEDHPYGHARYEYLSGLAVAAMIVVIGFELAKKDLSKKKTVNIRYHIGCDKRKRNISICLAVTAYPHNNSRSTKFSWCFDGKFRTFSKGKASPCGYVRSVYCFYN